MHDKALCKNSIGPHVSYYQKRNTENPAILVQQQKIVSAKSWNISDEFKLQSDGKRQETV